MSFFVRVARYVAERPEFKKYLDLKNSGKSARYQRGIASYGKKVNSEERKMRILAELRAMGVKPRVRRKMGRCEIDHEGRRVHRWSSLRIPLIFIVLFLSSGVAGAATAPDTTEYNSLGRVRYGYTPKPVYRVCYYLTLPSSSIWTAPWCFTTPYPVYLRK